MDKRTDFLKGLAHILECDAQVVKPEAGLLEIGAWDSLSVMSAVVLIDDIYGKVVHGKALRDCVTVADVLALVE